MKLSVIGSGGWGTALAILLVGKGHEVTLWSWCREESEKLKNEKENTAYLPGVRLPEGLTYTWDLKEAVTSAEVVVTVLPSHRMRDYARQMAPFLGDRPIVNCTKGLEPETLLTMSACIREEIPSARIAVLSGPSHAEEVARNIPTAVVAASEDEALAETVQDIFMTDTFRVYTSGDVKGVELGGALKNVIALCAGMVDGLGYGDNTKAALMTRGLVEIIRLGKALGAREETFTGLTGNGDLIVTCTSRHSRNRRAGVLLGEGKTLTEALSEIHMVTEGVTSCDAAFRLAKQTGVEMPIVFAAHAVLYEEKHPREAVLELMMRDRKKEL